MLLHQSPRDAANAPALLGREAELARLDERLAGNRLVSLFGAPGVGKSWLARAAAASEASQARCADGVWHVDLAFLRAPAADNAVGANTTATQPSHPLRATLAAALHLPERCAHSDAALAQALRGRRQLLVIDNADHLHALLAPLVSALLAETDGLSLLLTSREPMALSSAKAQEVLPLAVPPADEESRVAELERSGAVRLFVQRVSARQGGFALRAANAASRRDVARICRAVAGMPQALDLVAARVPSLGLHVVAEQLERLRDESVAAPTPTPAPAPAPALALATVVQWTHGLMLPTQQRVWRRLAVFEGGFTLPEGQTVCIDGELDEWAVLEALEALVDKGLLQGPDEGALQRRFTVPACLHEHAARCLASSGEGPAMQRRHFRAQLAYWRRADGRALGDPAQEWVLRHGEGIHNLRAALQWALARLAQHEEPALAEDLLALAGHGGLLWQRAGFADEGVRACEQVLSVAGEGMSPLLRAGIDLAVAHAACMAPLAVPITAAAGLAAARRAAAAFDLSGDAVRHAYALFLQHTLMCRCEPAEHRSECLAQLQALAQPDWSDLLRRFERGATAYEARLEGEADFYLEHNRQELARYRALGAVWEAWSAAVGVMLAEHDAGLSAQAIATGRTLLAEMRVANSLVLNAHRLALWLAMLAQSGDVRATREALAEGAGVVRAAGLLPMLRLPLAWLALHEDDAAAAAQLLALAEPHGLGTFMRRSMVELAQRLEQALGAARLERARHTAMAGEGDALVQRLLAPQRLAKAAATASMAGSRPARQAS